MLSHTISSKSLAALNIPIVSIEREDQYICSVNTDNYMGGVQAAGLLASHNCDVLIHINSPTGKELPTYGRIQGFLDICEEQHLKHQVLIRDLKADYESTQAQLEKIIDDLDRDYAGQKKGIFISNDTHANIFLNLLFRKHKVFPEDYLIVGFDNSPISREAIIPISTVGQQIDKIAYEAVNLLVELMNERKKRRPVPLEEPIHKIIPPVLMRRETTEREERA